MIYNVQIDGWRNVPYGDRLRYLLEQISNDVADDFVGRECILRWIIELRLDTCIIIAAAKNLHLATFTARHDGSDFHFYHKNVPVSLQQMGEIIVVAVEPKNESVGI